MGCPAGPRSGRQCFGFKESWYLMYRNYEVDPYYGLRAKCVKVTETGSGCTLWKPKSRVMQEDQCCDFVYDVLCGTSPKYYIYDHC
nr:uncharacterized protein LOC126538250 [Dermacentor andersoni]